MCTEYTSFTHIFRLVLIPITKSGKWKILCCYRISFFSVVDHVCARWRYPFIHVVLFFSHHSLMKHLKDRFLWVTTRVCARNFLPFSSSFFFVWWSSLLTTVGKTQRNEITWWRSDLEFKTTLLSQKATLDVQQL